MYLLRTYFEFRTFDFVERIVRLLSTSAGDLLKLYWLLHNSHRTVLTDMDWQNLVIGILVSIK